jgi:hypothetical protein
MLALAMVHMGGIEDRLLPSFALVQQTLERQPGLPTLLSLGCCRPDNQPAPEVL